jgi:hypothetical protein
VVGAELGTGEHSEGGLRRLAAGSDAAVAGSCRGCLLIMSSRDMKFHML